MRIRGASLRERLARVPPALVIVLGLGVLARVAVWAAVSPVQTNLLDGAVYVGMADGELFTDPVRPVGYPLFLRAAHAVTDQIWWTVLLQNLAGIATACLLYATVRRIGAPVWAAVTAAAAILLSLDYAYLEHSFLAEPLFGLLLTGSLYAAVRALDEPHSLRGRLDSRHGWLLAAGLCLGFAAWVRNAGAPLIPFLALWIAIAIPGGWTVRVGRGLLAGGAATALVLTYFALNDAATGTFALTKAQGRVLYGRTAPFADCDKFDEPAGTEILCEQTPPEQRFGPDFYMWEPDSLALQNFSFSAADDAKLGEFARRAIAGQPLAYVETVGKDVLRNFIPGYNDDRPFGGGPYEYMRVDHADVNAPRTYETIAAYYDAGPYVQRGLAGTIGDLQGWLRVGPLLLSLATLLAIAGLVFARGRARAGIALLAGCGLLLLLIPAASISYNARYSVPATGPLVAAGAIGLWLTLARLRERRGERQPTSPTEAR